MNQLFKHRHFYIAGMDVLQTLQRKFEIWENKDPQSRLIRYLDEIISQ